MIVLWLALLLRVYDQSETELQLSTAGSAPGEHLGFTLKQYYQQIKLGQYISALIFKSDMILLYRNGFLLFLLETGKEEVTKFLQELGLLVRANLKLNLLVGESYFPGDALNLRGSGAEDALYRAVSLKTEDEDHAKAREGDVFVDVEQRPSDRKTVGVAQQASIPKPDRSPHLPSDQAVDGYNCGSTGSSAGFADGITPGRSCLPGRRQAHSLQQERTGYGGRRFKMYKFRSMKVGAASTPPKLSIPATAKSGILCPKKRR